MTAAILKDARKALELNLSPAEERKDQEIKKGRLSGHLVTKAIFITSAILSATVAIVSAAVAAYWLTALSVPATIVFCLLAILSGRAKTLKEVLQNLKQASIRIQDIVKKHRVEVDNLNKKIDELQKRPMEIVAIEDNAELLKDIEAHKKKVRLLEAEMNKKNSEIKKLEGLLQDASLEEAQSPDYQQTLEKSNLEKEIAALRENSAEDQRKINELNGLMADYEKIQAETQALVAELREIIRTKEGAIVLLEGRIQTARSANNQTQADDFSAEKKALNLEIDNLNNKIDELQIAAKRKMQRMPSNREEKQQQDVTPELEQLKREFKEKATVALERLHEIEDKNCIINCLLENLDSGIEQTKQFNQKIRNLDKDKEDLQGKLEAFNDPDTSMLPANKTNSKKNLEQLTDKLNKVKGKKKDLEGQLAALENPDSPERKALVKHEVDKAKAALEKKLRAEFEDPNSDLRKEIDKVALETAKKNLEIEHQAKLEALELQKNQDLAHLQEELDFEKQINKTEGIDLPAVFEMARSYNRIVEGWETFAKTIGDAAVDYPKGQQAWINFYNNTILQFREIISPTVNEGVSPTEGE